MNDLLFKLKEVNPQKTAYICSGYSITYGELIKQAEILSAKLRGNHSPVILLGNKEPYMLIGMIACLMVKRPYVPVETDLPQKRIEAIKQQIFSYSLYDGKSIIDNIKNESNYENIAYIIFTSGTEGIPKGVPIKRSSLTIFINWITSQQAFNDAKGKIIINTARFGFDLSVADIYFSLSTGSTLIGMKTNMYSNSDDLVLAMANNNPNMIVCTPTFMDYCQTSMHFNLLSSLSAVYFCGEILKTRTCKKLFEINKSINIFNAYGPTEATSAVTGCAIYPDMLNFDYLPCGIINNATCRIYIENDEIILTGQSVIDNYLNSDEKISLYKSGDIGKINGEFLYCFGRKSGYIKYKGYRISTAEIKKVILKNNKIKQCTIEPLCRNDDVVAVNCTVISDTITKEELLEFLKLELPFYMIPNNIIIRTEFSFSSNFKEI